MISFGAEGRSSRIRDPDTLCRKPWGRTQFFKRPRAIYRVKGMLGWEERRALYWIARHYYDGRGAIVDAGAYLGASAFCLAAGLVAGHLELPKGPIIHSYDYFRAIDPYVAESIGRAFGRPICPGDDTLDLFMDQIRDYAALIRPIPGDFLEARWDRGPIEILFVDIAKTQALNAHVVSEFFPHLIPGCSLLIQQDFCHAWHPYIQISMEKLASYFETLDGHIKGQSRLYRLRQPIPSAVLDEVAAYRYSPAEQLAALDALIARETGEMRSTAEVIKLGQLIDHGDTEAARALLATFVATYSDVYPKGLWWQQARDIAGQLGDDVLEAFAVDRKTFLGRWRHGGHRSG